MIVDETTLDPIDVTIDCAATLGSRIFSVIGIVLTLEKVSLTYSSCFCFYLMRNNCHLNGENVVSRDAKVSRMP